VSDDQAEGVILNSQTRGVTTFFAVFSLLGVVDVALNVHRVDRVIEGVAFFALMIVFAVRTAKSSITWDQQGVVGRSTQPTRRLPWSAIGCFEHREFCGLGARLHTGRWVPLMPYPRNRRNNPDHAIAALKAGLEAAEQREAP
jgi:hypothetical protein